MQCVQAV